MLQCVAVFHSVLQCVVHSVLQCAAVRCSALLTFSEISSMTLWKTSLHVCCSVLQYAAVCCSVLQCVAVLLTFSEGIFHDTVKDCLIL